MFGSINLNFADCLQKIGLFDPLLRGIVYNSSLVSFANTNKTRILYIYLLPKFTNERKPLFFVRPKMFK